MTASGHRLQNTRLSQRLGRFNRLRRFAPIWLLWVLLALTNAPIARASEFDECLLKNLPNVTSDFAAKNIKIACLKKSETIVPTQILEIINKEMYGNFINASNTNTITFEFNNNTNYIFTQLEIVIFSQKGHEKRSFRMDRFRPPLSPGFVFTGACPDPTCDMMIGPGRSSFTLTITSPSWDWKTFKDKYYWGVHSARGWLQDAGAADALTREGEAIFRDLISRGPKPDQAAPDASGTAGPADFNAIIKSTTGGGKPEDLSDILNMPTKQHGAAPPNANGTDADPFAATLTAPTVKSPIEPDEDWDAFVKRTTKRP